MKDETAHVRSVGGATWTATGVSVQQPYYSDCTAACQPTWRTSKAQADGAWPQVCTLMQTLGFGSPTPTTLADDRRGVDFVTSDGLRWGWRNRAASYLRFRDCTFRQARPSGNRTETDKLRGGAVDRLLWTWCTTNKLTDWLLLRADRVRPLLAQTWPSTNMGDATFCAVPFSALSEAGAVVACSAAVRAAL